MDIFFIVASLALILCAYLVKSKTLYIIFQSLINVLIIVNYIYLSNISSAIVTGIATVRFIVFYIYVKKFNDIKWWLIILFSAIAGASGILTVKAPFDYFYIASVILYTCCYKFKDLNKMKCALLVPLTMMLVYNIILKAYSGVIAQAFEILLILIQMIMLFINRKKKNKEINND